MKRLAFSRRLSLFLLAGWLFAPLLGGCSGARLDDASSAARGRSSYRIYWTATRAADNAPLLAASAPAEANRTSALRTDSTIPEENRPALPLLTASLSPMAQRAGFFELKVSASVQEVARNKKGKLKRSKRTIGALLPVRLGESQVASAEGDPIRLEVRVDAAR